MIEAPLANLRRLLGATCALSFAVLGTVMCGDPASTPSTESPATAHDASVDGARATGDAATDAAPVEASAEGGARAPSRPTATACTRPTARPAANAGVDAGTGVSIECTLDDGCTTKAGGRCNELRSLVWYGGTSLGTRCTYDACTTDDDCASGACGCSLGFAEQHVCLPQSNCKIDGDCSAGQVCGLSRPLVLASPGVVVDGTEMGGGGGMPRESLGYFCTTPNDECRPGEKVDGGASPGCIYAPDLGRWTQWYQP